MCCAQCGSAALHTKAWKAAHTGGTDAEPCWEPVAQPHTSLRTLLPSEEKEGTKSQPENQNIILNSPWHDPKILNTKRPKNISNDQYTLTICCKYCNHPIKTSITLRVKSPTSKGNFRNKQKNIREDIKVILRKIRI